METLVAADSLLNMECPDTLSLEQHYSTHTHTHLALNSSVHRRVKDALLMPLFLKLSLVWLLFPIKSVYAHHASSPFTASPAAQTFLPSLGDVITTPVTQVTVSAEGIMGAFDQTQWPSLHTNKPTVQLQTKKRGQSLSISRSQVNYALSNCVICLTHEPVSFFKHAGRKPRHRRAESPTPDIIVKKDKYNKGTFTVFSTKTTSALGRKALHQSHESLELKPQTHKKVLILFLGPYFLFSDFHFLSWTTRGSATLH